MEELYYDQLLNIHTSAYINEVNNSIHHHPYEPTPYNALIELFKQYRLKENDHIIDFGCGKGRLNFFIHHQFRASVTGIEMNERFLNIAFQNKQTYMNKHKSANDSISFHCTLAEQYEIQPRDNIFYFFNPFSVQVFMKVVQNILLSIEDINRSVDIILFYPSDDYIYFLTNHTSFEFIAEVDLSNKKDQKDRFLIYRLDD